MKAMIVITLIACAILGTVGLYAPMQNLPNFNEALLRLGFEAIGFLGITACTAWLLAYGND